jgi:hypothetical protein
MGKHLTTEDIEDIVRLLDGWTGKLTWPTLCKACKPVIGTAPTRQTLMKFTRISTAFKLRKGTCDTTASHPKTTFSLSAEVYTNRLKRLQRENERLTQENKQLLHQFAIWQYNAFAQGLSYDELGRSLPSIKPSSTPRPPTKAQTPSIKDTEVQTSRRTRKRL